MKKLFALGAAAVLAFGLASCGQEEGKEIKLVYSGTLSDQTFNEGLFEDFKAQMAKEKDPNTYVIEYAAHGPDMVDSEVVDWSEAKAPDVYEFASDKLAGLYSKGALTRVTGDFKKFIDKELNSFAQACATFNETYYAYPYTGDNTYYLQYDSSVITAEQAKDMKSLMDAAQAAGKKVGYNLPEGFWGAGAMFTFGADYKIEFTEAGIMSKVTADFDGAKGLKAAKAILEIVQHPAYDKTSAVPSESSGVCAVIGGTWDIKGFKELWGDKYACAVMPTVTVDNETKNLSAFLGGKLLGVNPQKAAGDKAHLLAAHKLAKFLAGEQCQLKRFEHAGIAPCHVKASENEKVLASPNIAVLSQQGSFAHAQTSVPDGLWKAPGVLVNAMEKGECTAANLAEYCKIYNDTVLGKTTE